jgi:hypothetical protein
MDGTVQVMPATKLANLGGSGGETEFEQAFSSLAYAYLRDKAPRLLDNMVGFQLVDRNEDNTKAMGIFGFQLDKQWLYAPVFFLNGDLKGHELLYMKNNDSFVPMKENWINYIMSRKPHVLGESSATHLRDLGGMQPDIQQLSMSPSQGGGKRASDQTWVADVMPMLAAFKLKKANSLYPGVGNHNLNQAAVVAAPLEAALAKQASNLDFNRVMPTSLVLMKQAYSLTEMYPTIKLAMHKFYGPDCFTRWGMAYRDSERQAASNLMPKQASVPKPYLPGSLLIPTERPAGPIDHEKSGKLRVYVYERVITNEAPELDDSEREKLLHDTVLIKDKRGDSETSKAYNTQVEAQLTNPSETALYRVLVKPGEFKKMLVAMHGHTNRGRERMVTVVELGEGNRSWLNTYPGNVFADQISDRDEWVDWFEGLSDSDSLAEGGEYLAIDETGSASAPFRVTKKLDDGNFRVDFKSNIDWNESKPFSSTQQELPYNPDAPSTYDALLCVNKEGRQGTKIRAIGGELRIPATFKFLRLKAPPKPKCDSNSILGGCGGCCGCSPVTLNDQDRPIQLGKLEDIQLLFHEKTARLKVFNNGTDVYITSPVGEQRLTKKAALLDLISTHGLREKVAREILTYSEQKGNAVYRVNYAPGYGPEKHAAPNLSMLSGGPKAPAYADYGDDRHSEEYGSRNAITTQYASEQHQPVDDMSASNTDPAVWDNWQNYQAEDFRRSVQVAQQAGASGQKEVFDTSMISGMLKSVRQDSLVDRHLGSLVEALDSLGRLLMNFYWHSEEFQDRYGKSDLPELEDSLRNAFESLGDITLFLKEKTIESPFDDGDIQLEETARN